MQLRRRPLQFPALEEITIYLTARESSNVKRKNVKRTLPNSLNGETSMKIMLDAKLKKKTRELEKKRPRERKGMLELEISVRVMELEMEKIASPK